MHRTFPSPAALAAVFVIGLAWTHAAAGTPFVIRGSGANPAAIQPAIDTFRAAFQPNNGVGGSFATGRREVNWDGVPDAMATPNALSADFFNVTSPRGIVFNTIEEADGSALNRLLVSARPGNPDGVPAEFGDLNAQYPAIFQTFSAQRLMLPRADHLMEITFFVPGTTIPATVGGFGIVFADVDTSRGGVIRCFAADGRQLVATSAEVFNNGLSYLAVRFDDPTERIARVVVRVGNTAAGASAVDGAGTDIVAVDDVMFGEPRPQYELYEDGFETP